MFGDALKFGDTLKGRGACSGGLPGLKGRHGSSASAALSTGGCSSSAGGKQVCMQCHCVQVDLSEVERLGAGSDRTGPGSILVARGLLPVGPGVSACVDRGFLPGGPGASPCVARGLLLVWSGVFYFTRRT